MGAERQLFEGDHVSSSIAATMGSPSIPHHRQPSPLMNIQFQVNGRICLLSQKSKNVELNYWHQLILRGWRDLSIEFTCPN